MNHLDVAVELKDTKRRYEAFPCCVALCWVLFFAMGWVQIYRVSFANSCRITVYCVHDMWVP